MFGSKINVVIATLLATTTLSPLAAQPSRQNATPDHTSTVTIPDETVVKAGAALKKVIEIKSAYSPKVEAAPTSDARVQIANEELDAAMKAISDQGLTVDQYNKVMEVAQADPGVRERLLKATNLGQ